MRSKIRTRCWTCFADDFSDLIDRLCPRSIKTPGNILLVSLKETFCYSFKIARGFFCLFMYITTIKWLIRLLFKNTVMVLITLSFVFSVLQHSPFKLMFYSHFKGVVFLSGCVWILSIKLTTKSKTIKTGIHKYLMFYFDGFFFQ